VILACVQHLDAPIHGLDDAPVGATDPRWTRESSTNFFSPGTTNTGR